MSAPTCTGPDCARPAPDAYLCPGCTHTLERILAELPATLTDLQTTITRQARTSRSGGGKPTKASESPLPYDVHASDLADEVRNTLSTFIRHLCEVRKVPLPNLGQSRWLGTLGLEPSTRGSVCPPIPSTDPDWPEPTLCEHQRCALLRRDISRARQEPRHVTAMAVWLLDKLDSIRQDEWAAWLLTELTRLQGHLRAAVDNREYRYAGTCRAIVRPAELATELTGDGSQIVVQMNTEPAGEPKPCGADLKARVGAPTIVCRDCGAEYDAAEQAAWIDKESAEALATGPMIAHALAESGYRVKPSTIRNWAERTREWMAKAARRKDGDPPLVYEEHPIQQVACDVRTRLPLYPVGDVYRRVKADPQRRRETDQIGA